MTFAAKLAECKRLLGAVDPLSDLSARDNERGEVCAIGRRLDGASFIRDCASGIRSTTAVRPLQLALAGAAIDGGDSDGRDLSLALTEARRIAPDVVGQGPPWPNVFGA